MNKFNEEINFGLHKVKPTTINDLPNEVVLSCPTIQAAFRLSLSQSLVSHEFDSWADAFGLTAGAFNTILNNDLIEKKKEAIGKGFRSRYIPSHWFEMIAELTGNNAVGQWMYLYPKRKKLLEQIEERKLYQQLEIGVG